MIVRIKNYHLAKNAGVYSLLGALLLLSFPEDLAREPETKALSTAKTSALSTARTPAHQSSKAPTPTPDQVVADAIRQARRYGANMTKAQFDYLFLVSSNIYPGQNPKEARELAQTLCKSRYANAYCYCNLANTYFDEMGEGESGNPAQKALEKAISLDPKCGRAWCMMATLAINEGRFQDAINCADKAIACPNVDRDAYRYKAAALANLKHYDEALPPINKAIEMTPTHPDLYRIKGSILENLRRYGDAADCYRKSLGINRSDWTRFQLVRCLEMQNKIPEAILELNKGIALNPRDPESYRVRAQLKVKNKDLEGALKDYDKTIEQEPTSKSLKERADVHLKLGHKELYRRDLAEADKIMKGSY